jgi:hypothetical protein
MPSLRDAYKKSHLCKSSFVLSPPVVWQYVRLAVHAFRCLLSLRQFSVVGIFTGFHLCLVFILVFLFISFPAVGIFGVSRLVVVSLQHCPFRALLIYPY